MMKWIEYNKFAKYDGAKINCSENSKDYEILSKQTMSIWFGREAILFCFWNRKKKSTTHIRQRLIFYALGSFLINQKRIDGNYNSNGITVVDFYGGEKLSISEYIFMPSDIAHMKNENFGLQTHPSKCKQNSTNQNLINFLCWAFDWAVWFAIGHI